MEVFIREAGMVWKAESKEMGKAVTLSASDLLMRLLAFILTLAAAIVIATDKQTKVVPIQISDSLPPFHLPLTAKWDQMSAILYFLVTNAIACTYGALTLVVAVVNRGKSKGLWTVMTVLDAFMVALLFSGNGAAAAVGVLGYKGNSHVNWKKVCNVFDKFCGQMAVSIGVSLIGSLAFLLLVVIPVATREVIINETIGYIKELEKKKQRLEELKKLKETMKGLVTQILKVFCNHQAEILAANVTVNNGKLILAITALVQNNGNCVVEKIKREIMGL